MATSIPSGASVLGAVIASPGTPPATPPATPAVKPGMTGPGSPFMIAKDELVPPSLSIRDLTELLYNMAGDCLDLSTRLTQRSNHLLSEVVPQEVSLEPITDGSETSRTLRLAVRRLARINDVLVHHITHLEA